MGSQGDVNQDKQALLVIRKIVQIIQAGKKALQGSEIGKSSRLKAHQANLRNPMLLLCNILKCLVSKPPFIGAFSYFHFQNLYLQTSLAMTWPSNHTVPIDTSGCAV